MENQQNNQNVEVDLAAITRKLKQYGTKVNDSFFDLILFFKRNALLFCLVILVGAVLGYFLDKGEKVYENKIVLTPNFESTEYVYTAVELLNAKIKEQDSLFLKKVGFNKPSKLIRIEMKPVTDIFSYIDDAREDKMNNRIDLFRIMSENGDVEKIIEGDNIKMVYQDHIITITSVGKDSSLNTANVVLKFINGTDYFNKIAEKNRKNIDLKSVKNEEMIGQINNILAGFASARTAQGAVYYNDNTEVNELVNIKNGLIKEQARNELKKELYTKVAKDKAILVNILKKDITANKMKVILPILLVILTSVILLFIKYYKTQVLKRQLL